MPTKNLLTIDKLINQLYEQMAINPGLATTQTFKTITEDVTQLQINCDGVMINLLDALKPTDIDLDEHGFFYNTFTGYALTMGELIQAIGMVAQ